MPHQESKCIYIFGDISKEDVNDSMIVFLGNRNKFMATVVMETSLVSCLCSPQVVLDTHKLWDFLLLLPLPDLLLLILEKRLMSEYLFNATILLRQ